MAWKVLVLAAVAMLVTAAPAYTHSKGKGVVVEEEHTVKPFKDDGYAIKPPEPQSLGGDFEIEDTDGNTVTSETLKGKWILIYFGYPSCREACPTALENMTQALIQMGSEAEAVQPFFVDFSMQRP